MVKEGKIIFLVCQLLPSSEFSTMNKWSFLPFMNPLYEERLSMGKSRSTETQIVSILKESESGMKTADLCRSHCVQ
jgi:hypothetical protein